MLQELELQAQADIPQTEIFAVDLDHGGTANVRADDLFYRDDLAPADRWRQGAPG